MEVTVKVHTVKHMCDLEAGMVVRPAWQREDAGFQDMVVCQNDREKRQVMFARPYMYAVLSETSHPSYLIGTEEFWEPYMDFVFFVKSENHLK